MQTDAPRQQLRMIWPSRRLADPPPLRLHPDYDLRTYRPGDEPAWVAVMGLAGFHGWDDERLAVLKAMILPDGWFFITHRATGNVVATALANHRPHALHPFGGELGWVAGDPAHKGKRLGWTVCAAVTRRFLSAGYQNIYLLTDDERLPALATYLKLGYEPFLYAPDMARRWEAICSQVNWPFTPDAWPNNPPD
ncbi:MAG: GNAT family N-acetyltransferase [Caldilineaceae bacterium]|nr:GNAT family N-acetyltransferase [Caldilineaceae bacterium]